MLKLPASPRARERLIRRTIVGTVVVAIVILVVFFRNTGRSLTTPTIDRRAVVYHAPKHVPATQAMRAAAEQTLTTFVRTALIRRDLAESWSLATPHMRLGTSYREWLSGSIPVVPYPADAYDHAGFTLTGSYRDTLDYDVLVIPKTNAAGNRAGQQVYACELKNEHNRWLVDFCYPRKTL